MISSVGKASVVLNAVTGGLGLSLSASMFPAQHAGISSRSHAKSGCGRLFMMESASSTHELFVLAKLTNTEDKGKIINRATQERLKSLYSAISSRYDGRVAFDPITEEGACSALHLGEVLCELPVFRLVRDGLVVDEYHGHGNHLFEEELHKRIEAALSLSRKDDSCESSGTLLPLLLQCEISVTCEATSRRFRRQLLAVGYFQVLKANGVHQLF